jgi:hypothetical protein
LFQSNEDRQRVLAPAAATFADVQFVVKHDRELMSEPSAYHVRFVLGRDTNAWHPIEMIHVSTISGNSPQLLF